MSLVVLAVLCHLYGKLLVIHRSLDCSPSSIFRKIVETERFALRAAIFHECQNYLGGRGRIIPDVHPLGTFENQEDAVYLNGLTKK